MSCPRMSRARFRTPLQLMSPSRPPCLVFRASQSAFPAAVGGALECGLGREIEILAVGRPHQRRPIGRVFHRAAQHLGEQEAGGQMDRPDQRQRLAVVGPQPEAAPATIEGVLHLPLGLDPFGRMEEEILVEADPLMAMPPRRGQDDLDRQHLVLQQRMRALRHRLLPPRLFATTLHASLRGAAKRGVIDSSLRGVWRPRGRRPARFPGACRAGCGGWGRG